MKLINFHIYMNRFGYTFIYKFGFPFIKNRLLGVVKWEWVRTIFSINGNGSLRFHFLKIKEIASLLKTHTHTPQNCHVY